MLPLMFLRRVETIHNYLGVDNFYTIKLVSYHYFTPIMIVLKKGSLVS